MMMPMSNLSASWSTPPRAGNTQVIEWLCRPGPAGESLRVGTEVNGRIVAHADAV